MKLLIFQVMIDGDAITASLRRPDGNLEETAIHHRQDYLLIKNRLMQQLQSIERTIPTPVNKRNVIRVLPGFIKLFIRKSA